MSEMIERVAKAIQAKCRERGYNECPAPLVHHVAAAAIEAMREPTAEMLPAGLMADDGCEMPGRVYRAMIDAVVGRWLEDAEVKAAVHRRPPPRSP